MVADHQPTVRFLFLDWLRIIALGGLIVYHVGMYYVSWSFHVKSPFAGPGLEPWMKLTEPWRMSLIFMVSGAATACMVTKGPTVRLLRQRTSRLLLPLLFGVVLVVPPQSYFEVVQKFAYTGTYMDFLGLYFAGYRGFCTDTTCLILPTWNHLWFLPYIWTYTLLIFGLLAVWPVALQNATGFLEKLLGGVWLLFIPVALIFVARITLFDRYPATHALFGDWFSHVQYFGMFLCGAILAASQSLWWRMADARWLALVLALVFWASLVFIRPAKPLEHVVVAIFQWSALVAAFGFALKHLNSDSVFRQRLTEAVFPVYVLHQTVIIVCSQLLLPLQLAPRVEAPLLVALTVTLSVGGYLLIQRVRVLRPWFGLKPLSSLVPRTQ